MNSILRTAGVSLVVFAAVALLTHNSTGAPTITATTAPARHYYLTKAVVNGNHPLTSCATGYHFASFAELNDISNLTYNKTLGRTAADDGSGPPSLAAGWIRTGYSANSVSSSSPIPTNCNVWTSNNGTDFGEMLFFDPSGPGGTNGLISAFVSVKCDNSDGNNVGVWCIQN